MKFKLGIQSVLTVLVLGTVFYIGGRNIWDNYHVIGDKIAQDESYFENGGKNLEEDYRQNFFRRRQWINEYGILQKVLGRRIIGDVNFARNESDYLDRAASEKDVVPFANELVELKDRLDQKQIPLVYVQMPSRELNETHDPDEIFVNKKYYHQIDEITKNADIVRLDGSNILSGEGHPQLEEFYFRTDIHTATKGEIWMAKKLSQTLNENFRISIDVPDPQTEEGWEHHSHPMVGNFAQSVGEYYLGVDTFEEYIPEFPTHYVMEALNKRWMREGNFQEVLTNRYDEWTEQEQYIYWVTNYLQHGEAAYNICNTDSDGPNLLFICDSFCYRTISYLSLGCSNITILDPRFYEDTSGQTDPVEQALNEKSYDAVIYLHGTFFTTDYSMFGRGVFGEAKDAEGMKKTQAK